MKKIICIFSFMSFVFASAQNDTTLVKVIKNHKEVDVNADGVSSIPVIEEANWTTERNVFLSTPQPVVVADGIPIGGATGQILSKIDGDDYNVEWADASGGSSFDPNADLNSADADWSFTRLGASFFDIQPSTNRFNVNAQIRVGNGGTPSNSRFGIYYTSSFNSTELTLRKSTNNTGNFMSWGRNSAADDLGFIDTNGNVDIAGEYRVNGVAIGGGGSSTDLTYTSSSRLLESSTGTNVTLPIATNTEAGFVPEFSQGTLIPTLDPAHVINGATEGSFVKIGNLVFVRIRITDINTSGTPVSSSMLVDALDGMLPNSVSLLECVIVESGTSAITNITASTRPSDDEIWFLDTDNVSSVTGNINYLSSLNFVKGSILITGTYYAF